MRLNPIQTTVAIIAMLVAAYFSLTFWVFHGWASGIPPYDRPQWHQAWSWVFLALGLVSMGGAGWMTWRWRAGLKRWFDSLIGSEQAE